MSDKAKKYLLEIRFDDAHLPELFNDDDKSYYTIPELMEAYFKHQMSKELEEAEKEIKDRLSKLTGLPFIDEIGSISQGLLNHLKKKIG